MIEFDEKRNASLEEAHHDKLAQDPTVRAREERFIIGRFPKLGETLKGLEHKLDSKSGLTQDGESELRYFFSSGENIHISQSLITELIQSGQMDLLTRIQEIIETRKEAKLESQKLELEKAKFKEEKEKNAAAEAKVRDDNNAEVTARQIALRTQPFEIQIASWETRHLIGDMGYNFDWQRNLLALVKSADTAKKRLELFDWAEALGLIRERIYPNTARKLLNLLNLEVEAGSGPEARQELQARVDQEERQIEAAKHQTSLERMVEIRAMSFDDQIKTWRQADLVPENPEWRANMFALVESAQTPNQIIRLIDWLKAVVDFDSYKSAPLTTPKAKYFTDVNKMVYAACQSLDLDVGESDDLEIIKNHLTL